MDLLNTGKRSIHQSEVVLPPTIVIDTGAILLAELGERTPAGMVATTVIDSSRRTVAILTPLLNPGDHIELALYVASTGIPAITGRAHSEGLSSLRIVDARPSNTIKRSWYSPNVIAFAFSELAMLVAFAGTMMQIGFERRARKLWTGGVLQLRPPVAPFAFLAHVGALFGGHPELVTHIESQLSGADPTKALPDGTFHALRAQVTHFADSLRRSLRLVALTNLSFMCIMAIYFIWVTR